jgi:TPR repeat protein
MVDAMTALGEAMLHSCNGEKNPTGAARWLKAAAEQSNVSAQFSLGILYFNGDGVPKNPVEAKKWLGLAASKGHPSAKFYLDRLN